MEQSTISKSLVAGFMLLLAGCSQNNGYEKVIVKEEGTLYEQRSGEEWNNIKKLAIEGPLSMNDIAFIKSLDNNGLEALDLSKARNMEHLQFFFDSNKFSSITLPDSVESIDMETFQCCKNLQEVKLNPSNPFFFVKDGVLYTADTTRIVIYPAGLTQKSYTIPAKVTTLSKCMFAESKGLEEINVEKGNKVFESRNGVLYTKGGKILVAYPTNKKDTVYTLPKEVEAINWSALWSNKNLKRIAVEEGSSFKSIDGALVDANGWMITFPAGKSLTNYTIPSSIKALGTCAFRGCDINTLTISDSLYGIDKWAFNGSNIKDIKSTGHKVTAENGIVYIGKTAENCAPQYTGKTTVKQGLAITERAFQHSSFEEITIEPSMLIGPFAFSYNNNLKKVKMCEGLDDIKGTGIFFCCTKLEEADLPSSLSKITNRMFFGCFNLKSLTVRAKSCPVVDAHAFDGVDMNNCTLYVPAESIDRYKNSQNWNKFKDISAIK